MTHWNHANKPKAFLTRHALDDAAHAPACVTKKQLVHDHSGAVGQPLQHASLYRDWRYPRVSAMPVASTRMPVLALAMPDASQIPAAHIRPSTGLLLSFVPGIVSLRRPSAMAWQKARRCRTKPTSRKSFIYRPHVLGDCYTAPVFPRHC